MQVEITLLPGKICTYTCWHDIVHLWWNIQDYLAHYNHMIDTHLLPQLILEFSSNDKLLNLVFQSNTLNICMKQWCIMIWLIVSHTGEYLLWDFPPLVVILKTNLSWFSLNYLSLIYRGLLLWGCFFKIDFFQTQIILKMRKSLQTSRLSQHSGKSFKLWPKHQNLHGCSCWTTCLKMPVSHPLDNSYSKMAASFQDGAYFQKK